MLDAQSAVNGERAEVDEALSAQPRKYRRYPEYRDSGVEWLGEIPKHWEEVRLGYLAQLGNGSTPSRENPDYWSIGDVPWLTSGTINYGVITAAQEFVTPHALRECHLPVVPKDSVLVAITGEGQTRGRAALLQVSSTISQHLVYVIPQRDRMAPRYCWRVFQSRYEWLRAESGGGGSTRAALTCGFLRGIVFAVPPLPEQEAIAMFLDRETSRIEALVAKKERLIELLHEKRSALITRAVTKGLDPNVPMKDSGVKWLGEIPAHWEVHALKRTARPGRNTFVDGDWVELPFIQEEGIRLIQTGNVGVGEYRDKGFRYISEDSFRELKCTEVAPGDVLICRLDGPVGRACLAPDKLGRMITSVDNVILKSQSRFDPRFIVHFLSSTVWLKSIEALCRAGGGFRFRISRTMLGDLAIPVPPHREQRRIADMLELELSRLAQMIDKIEEGICHLRELRSALITAAVTGKIDVREEVA